MCTIFGRAAVPQQLLSFQLLAQVLPMLVAVIPIVPETGRCDSNWRSAIGRVAVENALTAAEVSVVSAEMGLSPFAVPQDTRFFPLTRALFLAAGGGWGRGSEGARAGGVA